MTVRVIRTLVKREHDGTARILSPDVGWWSDPPALGQPLAPGGSVGVLTRLGRRFVLALPEVVHGRVVDVPQDRHAAPVEYGQTLFSLISTDATERESSSAPHGAIQQRPVGDRAEGPVVVAPTDGIFYHRPSSGAAPYVEVGKPVRRGETVGLVEVMKTFNQIVFEGPGFPEEAVVKEVRAGEGEEVRVGQVLIVFAP